MGGVGGEDLMFMVVVGGRGWGFCLRWLVGVGSGSFAGGFGGVGRFCGGEVRDLWYGKGWDVWCVREYDGFYA